MFDHPESWRMLLHGLLQRLPDILVAILGIILALCVRRRAPAPAVLLLSGSSIGFVISLVWPFAVLYGAWRVETGAWEGAEYGDFMGVFGMVAGTVGAAGLALIVIAAAGWRGDRSGDPSATPVAGQVPPNSAGAFERPVRPLSKGATLGTIIGSTLLIWVLIGIGIALMSGGDGAPLAAGIGAVFASFIPLIFLIVVIARLVHRMWSALPRAAARTTPGKAVGLLFVPLFNWYWAFVAYWGWTVDYNRFVAAHGIAAPRMPEGLALAFVILSILSMIPYVGVAIAVVNLVILCVLASAIVDGLGALSRASAWTGSAGASSRSG